MPSVDVIYALHLKPGDLYAGKVDMSAATTPVQPFARAHMLTAVTPYTDDGGCKMLRLEASHGLGITPVRATMQVLVIRP